MFGQDWLDQKGSLWGRNQGLESRIGTQTTRCAETQQSRRTLIVLLQSLRSDCELWLDDFVSYRIPNELVGRVDAKLEHDLGSVGLYCPDCDSQRGGNFLVGFSLCQKPNNFQLAGGRLAR
jgi:hypothetical protein